MNFFNNLTQLSIYMSSFNLILITARLAIQRELAYFYLSYCIFFKASKYIEVAFCNIMCSIFLRIVTAPFSIYAVVVVYTI